MKQDFKVGMYKHKLLGKVEITDTCLELMKKNISSDSAFATGRKLKLQKRYLIIGGIENVLY